MLECMKNRRSIRKYTDQDIPESLLNELLEVATRASNTGNMQLYSVDRCDVVRPEFLQCR